MSTELDQQMEKDVVDLGLTAPRITLKHIQELMSKVRYETHLVPGTTTTIAVAIDQNGFTLATGQTACASPENFNEELGRKYAIKEAAELAEKELWRLEGYRLKSALSGMTAAK